MSQHDCTAAGTRSQWKWNSSNHWPEHQWDTFPINTILASFLKQAEYLGFVDLKLSKLGNRQIYAIP